MRRANSAMAEGPAGIGGDPVLFREMRPEAPEDAEGGVERRNAAEVPVLRGFVLGARKGSVHE
jgi:hypothetical protein